MNNYLVLDFNMHFLTALDHMVSISMQLAGSHRCSLNSESVTGIVFTKTTNPKTS